MTKPQDNKVTPLMKQYHEIKKEHPDTILLFQVGDFYEMFFDDAKQASAFLSIALTARGKNKGEPIPLCGVPIHALDHYLIKLVKGGFKVAICDQLEEPKPGTVVKRGVTQVLTPGTLTDNKLLDAKSASYLFSFFPVGDSCGLFFGELLTAQLFATTIPKKSFKILETELSRFFPDEVILPQIKGIQEHASFFKKQGYFITLEPDCSGDFSKNEQFLKWTEKQFTKDVCEQISSNESVISSLELFYWYVKKTQHAALDLFQKISFYEPDDFLMVDNATQRNLDLLKNNYDGGRKNSLLDVLDQSVTSMGSRTIKKWIMVCIGRFN